MSQSDILKLLKDLGGRASSSELIKEAKDVFPDRSLHAHVSMRLKALERRGLVSKSDTDDGMVWQITDLGEGRSLESNVLSESLNEECISVLSDYDIEIINVVAVFDTGEDMSLFDMDVTLSNVDYYPETDSHLNYYPSQYDSVTLRVPSSGRITVTGSCNKKELIGSLNVFSSDLDKMGVNIDVDIDNINIQNIVAITEINRELDLEQIKSDSGSNNIEYNPEKSPGLIFRPRSTGTSMIFRTGKINLMGVKSCHQLITLYNETIQKIPHTRRKMIEPDK
jgi:TATA-box binding protein (TBP) (component of TFIID and TFIIIB)